ncbi:hypothetical protein OPT61_g8697 [Boeremia exigua]|uniref:Uncharacterized protein n=1 Tax=Boeremia exigua TaxID=749465 RepID=A0ACC2HXS6_9PLEO|nr:hypothetical protein OPT61_g8697 [Boeremia exigua]
MADFREDDDDSVDSQGNFTPHFSPSPRSAQWPKGSSRTRAARPVIPSSSRGAGLDDRTVDEDRSQVQVQDPAVLDCLPVRKAAESAYAPIRKHARMDLGYVSDIAEADDSDDPDELDADIQHYAPLQMQLQDELGDDVWSDHPECEDVGSLTGDVTASVDNFIELANAIETDGVIPLIEAALIAENKSGSSFGKFFSENQDYWDAMSLTTLCNMPERVVKELVCGNLNDGTLMTTAEARRLARWLQRYISKSPDVVDHPLCKEAFKRIDHQFRAQWKRVNPSAERAFLASKNQDRIQSRVDNTTTFCNELIARCEASENAGTPLKPLTYIGYAARAEHRRRQHEACGGSSNWLATLVQAVCNVLWGHGHFQMHFMVICLLASEGQGMIAEMLLTRIAGAYYNVGGGFCINVAGKTMESIHFTSIHSTSLSHHENVDQWNDFAMWVAQETSLEANQLESVRRMRERRKRRTAALIAETEAKKAQLMPLLLKHYLQQQLFTSTLAKYPDHPALQDPELRRKVAQYAKDFKNLGKVFDKYK